MQSVRLGQRPTLVNTQGPIKLRRACYVTVAGQRAAAASQLAVIGLMPAVAPAHLRSLQQKAGPICTHFWKKCHYFHNDDTYRYKTPSHVLYMVVTHVCVQNLAIVRLAV